MTKLVINSATQKLIDSYVNDPAHAVCLVGEAGVGLGSIAQMMAAKLSKSTQTITTITPEKGTIPIEIIRGLYEQTRSVQQSRRCIVIDDADGMSPAAQNALLKLLEEPAHNVFFILTTHQPALLLATIRSRVQTINVLMVTAKESSDLIQDSELTDAQKAQALFLAQGKPAELTRLCTDKDYFAGKVSVVTDARQFLQAKTYDRLKVIKKYTERRAALEFLVTCAKLLSFSLLKQKNAAAADTMERFDEAMKRIEANGHVRTHLMHLVTKLP